jgi:carboxylate-amine ligase
MSKSSERHGLSPPLGTPDRMSSTDRCYDEAFAAPGEPRAHYAELLEAFSSTDLTLLRAGLNFAIDEQGASFGDHRFEVCPIPRLLTSAEAARLTTGLEQRVRALNAYAVDAYGERRIVAAGRLPEWVIESSEGYEPALYRRWPGGPTPIGVAGLDLVRAGDGELLVLEDNVRTPSGFAYASLTARTLRAALPFEAPEHDDGADALLEGVTSAIREALPGRADPVIAVISDGEHNSAHFEHALVAEKLGARLLRVDELVSDGARLAYCGDDGERREIDIVYRRCDEDRLFDEHGDQTLVGEKLLEPWLAGRIAIVNGFGTGVCDDKLAHAYVEEMVRFYLEEEPLLRSVPTLDLTREENLARLLDAPQEYVVKPRSGLGGHGVMVCAHGEPQELRRYLDAVRESPEAFVAQPLIALSTAPTVVGGRLVPRHVDLRPYVFSTPRWTRAVAAGLTRLAWEEGALVVNSSQNGGAKATWALR